MKDPYYVAENKSERRHVCLSPSEMPTSHTTLSVHVPADDVKAQINLDRDQVRALRDYLNTVLENQTVAGSTGRPETDEEMMARLSKTLSEVYDAKILRWQAPQPAASSLKSFTRCVDVGSNQSIHQNALEAFGLRMVYNDQVGLDGWAHVYTFVHDKK